MVSAPSIFTAAIWDYRLGHPQHKDPITQEPCFMRDELNNGCEAFPQGLTESIACSECVGQDWLDGWPPLCQGPHR